VKNSKLMLSTALAISTMLGVGAASAADLPMRAMPYTAPAPVFSWTGFYVGGNAVRGFFVFDWERALNIRFPNLALFGHKRSG